MYTLLRKVPLRDLLATQAPAFLISFVVAGLFHKFHSFMLETLAFLATWFVIDAVITAVSGWVRQRGAAPSGSER